MPEPRDHRGDPIPRADPAAPGTDGGDVLAERLAHGGPGLDALLADAQRIWGTRARDAEATPSGWRPFEDAFPTFYQFTNRPR